MGDYNSRANREQTDLSQAFVNRLKSSEEAYIKDGHTSVICTEISIQ